MADYLILIPLLPLLAAIINLLLGRKVTRHNAHWVSVPAVAVSWVCSLLVLREIWNDEHAIEQKLFTWIPSGSFNVPVNLFADQLTAVMLLEPGCEPRDVAQIVALRLRSEPAHRHVVEQALA